MIETKKSLRIAAGIILLVLAVYGLGSNIAVYFMGHLQGRVSFFIMYWNVLLTAALVVLLLLLFAGSALAANLEVTFTWTVNGHDF